MELSTGPSTFGTFEFGLFVFVSDFEIRALDFEKSDMLIKFLPVA